MTNPKGSALAYPSAGRDVVSNMTPCVWLRVLAKTQTKPLIVGMLLFVLSGTICSAAGVPSPSGHFAEDKDAALTAAALKGDVDEIDSLIKGGANPNAVSTEGLPILAWALLGHSKPGFVALLEHHANPGAFINHRSMSSTLPGMTIRIRDEFWFDQLLAHGLSPDYLTDRDGGFSIISDTISSDRKEMTALLIKKGADVNHRNIGGFTPLMQCVAGIPHFDTALALLNAGADWKPTTIRGKGFIDYMVINFRVTAHNTKTRSDYLAVLRWLSDHGAKLPDPLAGAAASSFHPAGGGELQPAAGTMGFTPEARRDSRAGDLLFHDLLSSPGGVGFVDQMSYPDVGTRRVIRIDVITPYTEHQVGVERWTIDHGGDPNASYIVRLIPDGRGGTTFAVGRDMP